MNIPALSSLKDLLDDKKFDSRRQDDEPLNIQEIIKKFIEQKSDERKQAKAKWLPMYEIIYNEIGGENCEGRIHPYTMAELQEFIEFMMIGNKIIVRVLGPRDGDYIIYDACLRFELVHSRTYLLEKINKISKITIHKIIFC